MSATKKTKAKKPAARKRIDWYQKGRENALLYWKIMGGGGQEHDEPGHIVGHLAVLCDESDEEFDARPKDSEWSPSMCLHGFADVFQERIEDLMERARLFDEIAKAARVGVSGKKAEPAKEVSRGS